MTDTITPKRALLIVDVQNDFCEGGALAVQGGNAVAKGVASHIRSSLDYPLVFASKDWHKAAPHTNCGHFALTGEPDFVKSWPVHCVQETIGAALHRALPEALIDAQFLKGNGTQSYSAFEGVTEDGISLLAYLRSNDVTDIDICGIATDYCVRASVLDARGLGFSVRVLSELCAGVDAMDSAMAMEEMSDRGAYIVGKGEL